MLKILFVLIISTFSVFCETGYEAWLRYPPVAEEHRHLYTDFPQVVVTPVQSTVINSSVSELSRGLNGMLGLTLRESTSIPKERSVILATIKNIKQLIPAKDVPIDVLLDGYHIRTIELQDIKHIVITGLTDAGVLYGTFALLRMIALYKSVENLNRTDNPYSPIRYVPEIKLELN